MFTSVFSELIPYVAALENLRSVLFWHSSKIDHYVRVIHLRRYMWTFDPMCAICCSTAAYISSSEEKVYVMSFVCGSEMNEMKVCTVAQCGKRTGGFSVAQSKNCIQSHSCLTMDNALTNRRAVKCFSTFSVLWKDLCTCNFRDWQLSCIDSKFCLPIVFS